jgi:hypothetical protein
VQVEKSGKLQYVAVQPGLAADGFVEIKPIEGSLEPGQLVVIGDSRRDTSEAQP